LPDWIKKQDPTICCLQETHLTTKDTHKLKVKGWKKQSGITILILDKADFTQESVRRVKEGHYVNKENNPTRRYKNSNYICTKHQNCHIHKTNTSDLKGTYWSRYHNYGWISIPHSPQQTEYPYTKDQQRCPRTKQYPGPKGFNDNVELFIL
jgi:hypothetical protein